MRGARIKNGRRYVMLSDLMEFDRRSKAERGKHLDEMRAIADEKGFYGYDDAMARCLRGLEWAVPKRSFSMSTCLSRRERSTFYLRLLTEERSILGWSKRVLDEAMRAVCGLVAIKKRPHRDMEEKLGGLRSNMLVRFADFVEENVGLGWLSDGAGGLSALSAPS